jgi:hypothetical protein
MKHALAMVAVLTALGAASGCSRAQARTTPDLPPLDVPAPPPRVVEVADPATLGPGTLVEEPARNTPNPRPPQPARSEPSRADTAKPPEPAPADAAPAAADEPARPAGAPTLQTVPANREQDVERAVKRLVTQARTNLDRVKFNSLNAGARTQYNQALMFVNTAEEALRQRNLVYAQINAEKAATLAAQLAGR